MVFKNIVEKHKFHGKAGEFITHKGWDDLKYTSRVSTKDLYVLLHIIINIDKVGRHLRKVLILRDVLKIRLDKISPRPEF